MHVYWWHVGELRAVKLGHADDPRQRVSEFRSAYGLSGEDVRGYELDGGVDVEWVESQLRRMLEANGLRRISLRLKEAGEEEFFTLDGRTFEDAHALLIDATRHIAFAEVSNQRKQQRRHEQEAAQAQAQAPVPPPTQTPETIRVRPQPPRQPHPAPPPSPPPAPARLGLYLVGAIVVLGVVAGLATLMARKTPSVARAEDNTCTIADLGNALIHVTCGESWVLLRWDGKWTFDRGQNERAALDFFNASDIARARGGFPPRGPSAPPPQQAEVKPEPSPPANAPAVRAVPPPQPTAAPPRQAEVRPEPPPRSSTPAVPATPPPQPAPPLPQQAEAKPEPAPTSSPPAVPAAPPPRQATSRPAMAPPQPPQEAPLPRPRCSVSRPKPGFQVYLVTCPNSQATIGRTVDSATDWAISESINGTDAIEFFMKSPYAR